MISYKVMFCSFMSVMIIVFLGEKEEVNVFRCMTKCNSIQLCLEKLTIQKCWDILFLLLTFQIYVVSSIMMYALPIFFNGYTMKVLVYILPHMIYVIHMALLGSIYSTVALAVERFIAVCYPFLKYRLKNDKM